MSDGIPGWKKITESTTSKPTLKQTTLCKGCTGCHKDTSNKIKVVLDEGASLPTRGSVEAAGLDLYAQKDTFVGLQSTLVPTGVHIAIPKGHVGLVRSRSGMAAKRNLYTEAGVIDSDYRGPIGVVMYYNCPNQGPVHEVVAKGERIAQLLIVPVNMMECEQVDSLDETERGEGGFGSTGK